MAEGSECGFAFREIGNGDSSERNRVVQQSPAPPLRRPLQNLLVVGTDLTSVDRIAAVARRPNRDIHRMLAISGARRLIADAVFDLVIILWPTEDLDDLMTQLRSPGSASRASGVLLVAPPDLVAEASAKAAGRVNRVVAIDDEDKLSSAINTVLTADPRRAVRVWVRLRVNGSTETLQAMCQTVNISRSGMLVYGCRIPPLGERVAFELVADATGRPISGCGSIVRHTDQGRERIRGFAISFTEVAPRDRDRFESLLGNNATAGGDPSQPATQNTRA